MWQFHPLLKLSKIFTNFDNIAADIVPFSKRSTFVLCCVYLVRMGVEYIVVRMGPFQCIQRPEWAHSNVFNAMGPFQCIQRPSSYIGMGVEYIGMGVDYIVECVEYIV